MTSKVDIIKEGYSRWLTDGTMAANGTSTLIRCHHQTVVFDTLSPWDRQYLVDRLSAFDVTPDDIQTLVCSHTHTDHIGNLNLFTNCRHIVGDTVYKQDIYQLNPFEQNKCIDLCQDMQIVATPGHTKDSISLVVKNVDQLGTVGICGDLFECETDLSDDTIWINAGSEEEWLQRQNRQMMLELCDYIIPGHGSMFRVKK